MVTRRLWLALALAAFLPAGQPAAIRADRPAPLAEPASAGAIDPAFARALVAEHPVRHILRSIAVDLDRDGDLDVIAATVEEPVVVWIRDGSGRFTRQRPAGFLKMGAARGLASPAGGAGVLGEASASTWQGPADTAGHHLVANEGMRRARPRGSSGLPTRALVSDPSRGPPSPPVA